MSRLFSYASGCAVFLILVVGGFGQEFTSSNDELPSRTSVSGSPTQISRETSASRSRLSAELALMTYLRHANDQLHTLASFSDITVVEAELPQSSQRGRLKLRRIFAAPRSLTFQAIDFAGDNFIKSNVIARLLQSEADHVQKGDGAKVAITDANYNFSYKGLEAFDGRTLYVYGVKPSQKRPGLFKGRIYLDPRDGSLVRAEGMLVKSPSLFVKKIRFVQDYNEVAGFSLPVHLHSVAETRIAGRAIVDIVHSDYDAHGVSENQTSAVAR
jgi:hypothetical protein